VARHRLQQRVHLVGAQTPDQLADWYNAADLFCSATTREGSPNVLLEAMACGLPCVTTPVGGNREAVTTMDVGLLAPPDASALATAMTAALQRTWNRARIAEQARRRTWSVVADECREHLRRLAPEAR
jgi:glycosyltransferase involved in cell wall biosynthesis